MLPSTWAMAARAGTQNALLGGGTRLHPCTWRGVDVDQATSVRDVRGSGSLHGLQRVGLAIRPWVYAVRSAALSAPSRAASLNGLARHSTAPRARRSGRTPLSAWAVMKTIGIS